MKADRFKILLDELDGNSLQTLKEKNARYSQNGDCLHNFRSGADIAGGTPAQACWGYLTKHLVALRDMVLRDDFSDRDDFLEKCQDTINYIRFLWCIGNEGYIDLTKEELESIENGTQDVCDAILREKGINRMYDSWTSREILEAELRDDLYIAHTSTERKRLEKILETLRDDLNYQSNVSCASLCRYMGILPGCFDDKSGWDNLNDAKVASIGEGYALILPKPKEL